MRIHNEDLELDGTDMESNITSDPLRLESVINYSIQVVFTGSANGSFKLQASNDDDEKLDGVSGPTITNWTDIDGSTKTVTAAGNIMYDVENTGYKWVRLVWTDSSSSGADITVARYHIKGL